MNLSFYKWLTGSESDFLRQFQDNDYMYGQAQAFWSQLNGTMVFVLIAMLLVGILMALFYYWPFNNWAGRLYRVRYWSIFMGGTYVLTLFVTIGIEYILCRPELDGTKGLEIKVALANALYASIVYFITSVIWCNFLPTNAYRFFKFQKL